MRSSVKESPSANDNLDDDLIGRTRQVWEPRLGRNLSSEDVRQITENLTGFFALLAKWSRAERTTAANDNDAGLSTNPIVTEEHPAVCQDGASRGDV